MQILSRLKQVKISKRLSLSSLSVMALSAVLIVFGQGIAYYSISGIMQLFSVKLQVPEIVFWLRNMPYFGLIPQAIGATILLFFIFRSRLQVNMPLLKKQLLRVFAVSSVFAMVAVCAFVSTPLVNAQLIDTSQYYLQVPLPLASMYVGEFSNNICFCINGSNWQDFYQNSNLTLVEQTALSDTPSGNIWSQDLAFNYNLTIPANVSWTENLNGLQRVFVNSANSQGAPYTISVDNMVAGYYLCQDSAKRYINDWGSTNAGTVIQTAINSTAAGGGGLVKLGIGKFTVTSSLLLNQAYGVQLVGSGFDPVLVNSTIIYSNNCNIINVTNSQKNLISNLVLEGNYGGISHTYDGIYTDGTAAMDLHVEDVYLLYISEFGINYHASHCTFQNVFVEFSNQAFNIAGSLGYFQNCYGFSDTNGLQISGIANTLVSSYEYNTGGTGTNGTGSIGNSFIINGGTRNTLIGCKSDHASCSGVIFYSGTYNIIQGMQIYDAGERIDNVFAAVEFQGTATYNTITGTDIIGTLGSNNTAYGFDFNGTSVDYNTISAGSIVNVDASTVRWHLFGVHNTIDTVKGYNPIGYMPNPVVTASNYLVDAYQGNSATWASGTVYTNIGTAKTLYVSGGTVTEIDVNSQNTGLRSGSFVLQPSDNFSCTASSMPTIVVYGQ